MRNILAWLMASVMLATTPLAEARGPKKDDDREGFKPASPFRAAPKMRMEMGATPGGAQDIDFARDRISAGEVPHERTFTPEGLLSQHDLPLPSTRPCTQILCLEGAGAAAELIAQPEVRFLTQLGFGSNLNPKTWRRAPLSLVAVVDKSGSMSGQPLDTVKASLRHIALQMTAKDQLSIVLYGDKSHVHLEPTRLSHRAAVLASIEKIESAGSTAMEEGLRVGFDVAQQSRKSFAGTTRVMLFTDERPNVGRTDKDSFMGMAREASRRGVGMTTVGVSTHFGAELATAISSVRGGNLYFFPDAAKMSERFVKDFDTMVTELAHDMRIVVTPRKGYEILGVYGVPGELVKRTANGGLSMTIETVFLSHDQGGIYFALAPKLGALPAPAGAIADAKLSYTDTTKHKQKDALSFSLVARRQLPLGLARGELLIDEITTLKRASILHGQQNKTEEAYRLVRALRKKLADSRVTGLEKELLLVTQLDATLTRLSGHKAEGSATARRDAVNGLPE
ncbi:MAG: VWA domain-containing protein [Myxococcales bacterium]|nr:VWA domain-containing protein [Myxococcales bacterium]